MLGKYQTREQDLKIKLDQKRAYITAVLREHGSLTYDASLKVMELEVLEAEFKGLAEGHRLTLEDWMEERKNTNWITSGGKK